MLAMTVAVITVGSSYAAEMKEQTVCPVSGKPIDKSVYSDHDGKRVYFCCTDCQKQFEKNPEAMMMKMKSDGVMLASTPMKHMTQTVCPISGKPIDNSVHSDYEGKRVYFCCTDCQKQFEKDPKAVMMKMEKSGVTPEKVMTHQTMCPVSGEAINKSVHADYMGKRVYFCCPDCEKAFKKDPAKYIKKLEDEGVELDKVS